MTGCSPSTRRTPRPTTGRGWAYAEKGEYARAIADCNQAIRLDPQYAQAYDTRGYAYAQKGNAGWAMADYDRAIALDPEDGRFYFHKAALLDRLGRSQRAVVNYRKFLELAPATDRDVPKARERVEQSEGKRGRTVRRFGLGVVFGARSRGGM